MEEERDRVSLREEIKRLNKAMSGMMVEGQRQKEKKWRLPFGTKINRSNAKKNYVIIQYINENREVMFTKQPIVEGTVTIDGVPHLATTDYMLTHKNMPMIIIPSWNIKPFSPEENYDDATRQKNTTVGYRLLLNMMKNEVIAAKKKFNMMMVVIILIAIGVGIYFLTKGGGLKF